MEWGGKVFEAHYLLFGLMIEVMSISSMDPLFGMIDWKIVMHRWMDCRMHGFEYVDQWNF